MAFSSLTDEPRVAVFGSRTYPDLNQVERFVRGVARKYPGASIVSGGARGVDTEAEQTGGSCMLPVRSYRPKKRGRSYVVLLYESGRFVLPIVGENGRALTFPTYRAAAFARNGWIAEWATVCVGFWDRRSGGTKDTIDKAMALQKPLFVYGPPTEAGGVAPLLAPPYLALPQEE